MRTQFVMVKNVVKFTNAVDRLDGRGAREASLVVVSGDAGLGKSRTAVWWAVHNDAAVVRVKAAATPAWVLADLVRELGLAPARTTQDLFGQAVGALAAEPRPIVVDEVEHALARDIIALDTIRGLSDLVEVPVILIGREHTAQKLKRHRQIWSRIGGVCEFRPLDEADVALCCQELVEGTEVADEVAAEIARLSEGRIRDVLGALAAVERTARARKLSRVDMEDVADRSLAHPWRRPARRAA